MKNGYIFCFFLLWSHSYATQQLVRYANSIIQQPLTTQSKPSPLFDQYKKQIDSKHAAVENYLLNLHAQKITTIDATTKQFVTQQKKEQQAIVQSAQKQLTPQAFNQLQTYVAQQQSFYDELLENWNSLSSYFQKYALSFFKTQITNPYKDKPATVQSSEQLPADELNFIKARSSKIKKGFVQFFGDQTVKPFTIGYVGPGGGYRAMILTSGYLAALEDEGLVDATTYMTALSGSTWFLTPWIFYKGSVRSYQQTLLDKIAKNIFNPVNAIFTQNDYISTDYLGAVVGAVWPKFVYNQQLSSVDVYGSLIANALLSNAQTSYHITDQWDYVKDGSKPFPMYTSVCTYNQGNNQVYNWNEFTPLQMTNLDLNLSIPVYAFGSEFDGGKSVEIAPQQSLGYMMGTFGSAYLLDLLDIKKICESLKQASQNKGPDLAAEYLVVATILNLINVLPISINEMRVLPSTTFNPYKNASFASISPDLKKDTTLMYVDGGIAYNIPVRPLLRKNRNVKVIIIGDTSGNNPGPHATPDELNKFFQDAKRVFGYVYTRVDDKSTETLRLYKDKSHAQAPLIIYFNFVNDKALLTKGQSDPALKKIIDSGNLMEFDFNCIANYPNEYCSFLYFGYTQKQFNQLRAIAEFNIKANIQKVRKFLQTELISLQK